MDHSAKVLTGIPGLDEILGGGLPARRLHIVSGSPGAGKTTLCLQFLIEGARRGERVLFVTLSETASEVRAVAKSHGWALDGVSIFEAITSEREQAEQVSVFHPADVELGERMTMILGAIDEHKPHRLVIDSATELRLLAQNALRYRRQILALRAQTEAEDRTVIVVDNPQGAPDALIHSLAYGVIEVRREVPGYGPVHRHVIIHKMRGSNVHSGMHDFEIVPGGIRVFPRVEPLLEEDGAPAMTNGPGVLVSSGIAGIDQLLGGGIKAGRAVLLVGPAGVGKSALASQFVVAAAERGERGAIFTFDEPAAVTLDRADGLGMPLRRHVANEMVHLHQMLPSELSPGLFSDLVRRHVEVDQTRVVVIDSLNGYRIAMADALHLSAHLHDLLVYLGRRGILTLLVVSQHGVIGEWLQTDVDVSYLADAVMLLRYFEVGGRIRKALSVVKLRTGAHESTIRELVLGPRVFVGEPLAEFDGVLTGVPRFHGEEGAKGPLMGS